MKFISAEQTPEGVFITRHRGDGSAFSYHTATPARYGFHVSDTLKDRASRIISTYEDLIGKIKADDQYDSLAENLRKRHITDNNKLRARYLDIIDNAKAALNG